MLHTIKGLKKCFLNKKIYIWNVNRSSAVLWLDLGLRQINVLGFVVSDDDYEFFYKSKNNYTLFNRPVISLKELESHDNSLLVIVDEVVSLDTVDISSEISWCYYSDLWDINEDLCNKNHRVFLYGAGNEARKCIRELNAEGIKIFGFCQTEKPVDETYQGMALKQYNVSDFSESDCIVIAVKNKIYRDEIIDKLHDFPGEVYVDEIIDQNWKNNTILHQLLYRVIKENRRLFICSRYDLFMKVLELFLENYDINITGHVYLKEQLPHRIKDIYTLGDEDIANISVVVNERDPSARYMMVMTLRRFGLTSDIPSIAGLQIIDVHESILTGYHYYGIKDALYRCGATSFDKGRSFVWKMMRPKTQSDISIMILGGSTSSADLFYPETWMEKLYKKLCGYGMKPTFFIGGAPGKNVVFEFLNLLRDGYVIKPDIVISFSGVNNAINIKGETNQFNIEDDFQNYPSTGIPIKESVYEFWIRIQKMMELYSSSWGSKFISILQPFNIYMPEMSLEEKLQFEFEEFLLGAKSFYEESKDDDFYLNLIHLLHHKEGVYFDGFHYTEKGAEIIADRIFSFMTK